MNKGVPVRIRSVSKAYDAIRVLHDVDLEVMAGEFVTLLGPSGSGKTTLLMILGGFVAPDTGNLLFGDRSVIGLPPHRRNIGMVFQNYALFPHLTVFENVAFPLRVRHVGKADVRRRVRDALSLVRLDGYGDRRTHQLSGGQRQRVALARAIVFEPDILLMDEPLSALDKKLREQMQVEIRRLHGALGLTTIYVTHDQREALAMSDRVAVLNHGRVEQFADPRSIYNEPATSFVADFIGESFFIPVQRNGSGALFAGIPIGSTKRLPECPDIQLVIRPEKLRIAPDGEIEARSNYFQGRVVGEIFHGDTVVYDVELTGGTVVAVRNLSRRGGPHDVPGVGQPIRLALHHDDTVFLGASSGG